MDPSGWPALPCKWGGLGLYFSNLFKSGSNDLPRLDWWVGTGRDGLIHLFLFIHIYLYISKEDSNIIEELIDKEEKEDEELNDEDHNNDMENNFLRL